jgi:hypothetical protein
LPVKQNPFSLYDFLGYFIPGAVSLYVILGTTYHAAPHLLPFEEIQKVLPLGEVGIYVPFILLAYLFGHLLSFLSSVTVEKYAVWMYGYPSKYLLHAGHDGYFSGSGSPLLRWVRRTFVLVVLAPVVILDIMVGKLLGVADQHTKPLDPLLRKIVRSKTVAVIQHQAGVMKPGKYGRPREHDFFRYLYHYAVESCPNHLPKMQNYVGEERGQYP